MIADTVVLHAGDADKAVRIAGKKPFAWLYLGHDIGQKENISLKLGGENSYSIGNMLQEVAYQQKPLFLDFMVELGRYQKNKLYWWASDTAYRCPLTDDLFLLWCYASIFEKVCLEKRQNTEKFLFAFIEDRWLYRYLYERYRESSESPAFPSRKSVFPELLKLITRGILGRGYFLLINGLKTCREKATGKNIDVTVQNIGEEVYIYSWIKDRSFARNGDFNDAYLGRLPQFLKGNGLNVTYITPLFLAPSLKNKCLNHGEYKYIFLDRYLSIKNILRSFFSIFKISLPSNPDRIHPSFKVLLQRQAAHEFPSFPGNILNYFIFKECLKKITREKMVIIYPFENQPWEKMLCLAAKETGKDVKLVGYQHSRVPLLLLNYFPGTGESRNMPLPQYIVTNGEYTLDLLGKAGYGNTRLVNGGALRYEYLQSVRGDSTRQTVGPKTVLAALPYSRSLSEEMLLVIFETFKDLAEEKLKFLFKFHPEVPLEHLEVRLPSWPAHFQKTVKPTSEVLEEVDLVIYSSSAIGLEALLAGVPVVRYCPQHAIELDPLDALDENMVRCCSEDNIRQVVLSTLHNGGINSAGGPASNTIVLDKLFSPVNEEVWRQLVEHQLENKYEKA